MGCKKVLRIPIEAGIRKTDSQRVQRDKRLAISSLCVVTIFYVLMLLHGSITGFAPTPWRARLWLIFYIITGPILLLAWIGYIRFKTHWPAMIWAGFVAIPCFPIFEWLNRGCQAPALDDSRWVPAFIILWLLTGGKWKSALVWAVLHISVLAGLEILGFIQVSNNSGCGPDFVAFEDFYIDSFFSIIANNVAREIVFFLGALKFLKQETELANSLLRNTETATDIAAKIANYDVDNIEVEELLNSESDLDKGLGKIVSNLRMYKPFLPDSLFVTDADTEDDPHPQDETSSAHSGSVNKEVRQTESHSSRTRSESSWSVLSDKQPKQGGKKKAYAVLNVDMAKREKLTWVVFRMAGVNPQDGVGLIELKTVVDMFCGFVFTAVHSHNGQVMRFGTQDYIGVWNTVRQTANHAVQATGAAWSALDQWTKYLKSPDCPEFAHHLHFHASVVSGVGIVGTCGTAKHQTMHFLGSRLRHAIHLCDLASQSGTPILLEKTINQSAQYAFMTTPVDVVGYHSGGADNCVSNVTSIYACHGENNAEENEWMYQLKTQNGTLIEGMNEIFQLLKKSDFKTAKPRILEKLKTSEESTGQVNQQALLCNLRHVLQYWLALCDTIPETQTHGNSPNPNGNPNGNITQSTNSTNVIPNPGVPGNLVVTTQMGVNTPGSPLMPTGVGKGGGLGVSMAKKSRIMTPDIPLSGSGPLLTFESQNSSKALCQPQWVRTSPAWQVFHFEKVPFNVTAVAPQ